MKKWTSDTMGAVLTKDEDYIYIGAPHTFASRFILVDTANTASSAMEVEYYSGKDTWTPVLNLADETRSGAVTLAQSGFISWDLPAKDWYAHQLEVDTDVFVPELESSSPTGDGYGYYWVRISASETLDVDTAIKWLGVIWTNQAYLELRWKEVTTDAYLPTGQSDWYETIELATRDVGTDLKLNKVIEYELQAKDIGELADMTALKTLDIILTPMTASETLRKMKEDFKKIYDKYLGKPLKKVDIDGDEKLSRKEHRPFETGRMVRR